MPQITFVPQKHFLPIFRLIAPFCGTRATRGLWLRLFWLFLSFALFVEIRFDDWIYIASLAS